MKKARLVALVAAGKAAHSFISGLPGLAAQLGPVKASSFRVASRIVNVLRAGHPVHDTDEFANCRMVLICVHHAQIEEAVQQLSRSTADWSGRTAILCDAFEDSRVLAPLARRGALTASVNSLQIGAAMCVAEGDPAAIREFKRMLLPRSARVLRLNAGAKPLFLAGIQLASLHSVLAAAATDCFRAAGATVGESRKYAQEFGTEALRAVAKAGRKAVGAEWDREQWDMVQRQLAALRESNAALAGEFERALQMARCSRSAP
jgi:hypothetical protein